jgi:DNA polymerase III delta subunit
MVIFLYGIDSFRARRRLNELKKAFIDKYDPQGLNILNLEGDKLNLGRLSESVGANSMFSTRRFVIIEGFLSNKDDAAFDQVRNYLEGQTKSDTIVVFLDPIAGADDARQKGRLAKKATAPKAKPGFKKFLIAQPHSQEFVPLKGIELSEWVRKEVKERGAEMTNDALAILVALTGGDLWQIDHELGKLIDYVKGQQLKLSQEAGIKISAEIVRELVRGVFQENIFALTDAIGQRQKAQALKLLEMEIAAGQPIEQVYTMIVRQFRVLIEVRQTVESGMPQAQIAKELGLHPYVAQKSIAMAKNYSLNTLKQIFNALVRDDFRSKTGQADLLTSLETLIAKL